MVGPTSYSSVFNAFSRSTGFSLTTPKPPNILIYSPRKEDSTRDVFCRTKQSLETCLTPERYVIYPLGLEDIVQYSPWKSNCKLLVVPPITEEGLEESQDPILELTPKVIEEMATFARAGGSILSLHSQLNMFLELSFSKADGFQGRSEKAHDDHESGIVKFKEEDDTHEFLSLPPNQNGRFDFSGIFLNTPLADVLVSEADVGFYVYRSALRYSNTNQSNNSEEDDSLTPLSSQYSSVTVVKKTTLKGGGKIVTAAVDLLPVLPTAMKLEKLIKLSRGVPQRRVMLSSLLTWFDLACSKESLPELTHTYLLCSDQYRSVFLDSLSSSHLGCIIPGQEVTLYLISNDYTKETPVDEPLQPSESKFTIITRPAEWQLKRLPFSSSMYFSHLESREIGRSLLYTPVITSTQLPFTGNMSFCQALSFEMGVAWVAAQQTQGKGRSGNMWISPIGSMMFTLPLPLSPASRLSHHLPLLQHMVGVAVVHGIRTLPGYEAIPIRIKWPNDIYHEGRVKLGGILVSCVTVGKICTAIVGCGVNVCNTHPTISVNKSISLFNQRTSSSLPPLTVEQTLARTFNCLEKLLTVYEVEGEEPILKLYYKYWLHSGSEVILSDYNEEKANVVGVDKYGYLQVLRKTGEIISLQPDGNSFDITKGLIAMKT